MKNAALTLTTLLALTISTSANPEGEGSLKQARDLFERVDRDGDARISALEAGRNGIPSKEFVAYDVDRDRKLSESEFTLFYRQLIIKAGKNVDEDLDAEVARITAARRAKKDQDAERTDQAREKALADAKRAEAVRQAQAAEDLARAEKVREEQQRLAQAREEAARAAEAKEAKEGPDGGAPIPVDPPATDGKTDAERAEAARVEKAAADAARAEQARQDAARVEKARKDALLAEQASQDAARIEKARIEKAQVDAARAAAARQAELAQAAARAEEARKGGQPKTPRATPEQRAAGYVRRLVDGGRMTEDQAKDFHAVLTAAGPAADPLALRAALVAAKKRISSFVVSGSLTSDEGRELASALDARAKAALPVEDPGPGAREETSPPTTGSDAKQSGDAGPSTNRRGTDGAQQGQDKGGQGTGSRRATDKQDAGTRRPARTGGLGGESGR